MKGEREYSWTERSHFGYCPPLTESQVQEKDSIKTQVSFTCEKVDTQQLFLQTFVLMGDFGLFQFCTLLEIVTIILSWN